MQKLEIVIYLALAIAAVAFAYTHWRTSSSGRAKASPRTSPRQPRRVSDLDASALLTQVGALRKRRAQWPEILATLNPTNDPRVSQHLQAIRGPHMFDPNTALGVIEAGCRDVGQTASAVEALAAATESMNKVVHFGR